MIYKVFTVYDSKVEAYMSPFMMQSKGQAIRSFGDECNNSDSMFCKHPEDFTLFEIAEYDDQLGVYNMHDVKIPLGTALENKRKVEVVK